MKLAAALALLALASCTKSAPPSSTDAPGAACTKEGQQCVFAAGKIGLCTAIPGTSTACDGGPCLTCMSLH